MKIKYSFRRRNWSNYLVDYTNKKGAKLKIYEDHKPFFVQVTFTDDGYKRLVSLCLESGGDVFASQAETDDYFAAIDIVFDKITKQLEKLKTKTKSQKRRRSKNKKVIELVAAQMNEEKKAA